MTQHAKATLVFLTLLLITTCFGGRYERIDEVHVLGPGILQKSTRRLLQSELQEQSNLTDFMISVAGEVHESSNSFAETASNASVLSPPARSKANGHENPFAAIAPEEKKVHFALGTAGSNAPDKQEAEGFEDIGVEASHVSAWVDFFIRSRLTRKYTEDPRETAKLVLGALGTTRKIQVRLISGAAGKLMHFGTRKRWTDLDLWINGIQEMKHKRIIERADGEEENQMKWHPLDGRTDEETALLAAWEASTSTLSGKKQLKELRNIIEIDAWDPMSEEHKIITPFLFTY